MRPIRTLLAVAAAATAIGCTSITKTASGDWSYRSFGNRKSIGELTVSADNALKVKGYTSTQAENIEAASRGAASAFFRQVPGQ